MVCWKWSYTVRWWKSSRPCCTPQNNTLSRAAHWNILGEGVKREGRDISLTTMAVSYFASSCPHYEATEGLMRSVHIWEMKYGKQQQLEQCSAVNIGITNWGGYREWPLQDTASEMVVKMRREKSLSQAEHRKQQVPAMSSFLLKWAAREQRKTLWWDQIHSLARSVKGERGGKNRRKKISRLPHWVIPELLLLEGSQIWAGIFASASPPLLGKPRRGEGTELRCLPETYSDFTDCKPLL